MSCLIKKLFLFFSRFSNLIPLRRSFSLLFTNVYVLKVFSYFCCSLLPVSKKQDVARILTLFIQKAKVKKIIKKKQAWGIRVWVGAEYVTRQIINLIL